MLIQSVAIVGKIQNVGRKLASSALENKSILFHEAIAITHDVGLCDL